MNSRERVFRAIKFECPDRIPVIHEYLPGALLKYGEDLINLFRKYPNDFLPVEEIKIPQSNPEFYRPDGSYYREYTDEWGLRWAEHQEGIVGQVIGHPLSDWDKMKDYKIPTPAILKPGEKDRAKARFGRIKDSYILWGGGFNFFERMQWLRGYEALLIDMVEDREEVYILADRLLDEYIIPLVKAYLEIGAEIISLSDDWGTQNQLMINPALWRKIFKPRYKKIFDLCHEANALVYMHSDGMIMEIIPDLIEIGLNVINPQFSCMDLEELKRITEHKICISTDIDRQKLLPFGTPEEVRKYVQSVFELLACPEGGLMWRGEVGPDVPLQNVEAMLKAFYEFSMKNK